MDSWVGCTISKVVLGWVNLGLGLSTISRWVKESSLALGGEGSSWSFLIGVGRFGITLG